MLSSCRDPQRRSPGARAQQREVSLCQEVDHPLGAKMAPRAPAVPRCRGPETLARRSPREMMPWGRALVTMFHHLKEKGFVCTLVLQCTSPVPNVVSIKSHRWSCSGGPVTLAGTTFSPLGSCWWAQRPWECPGASLAPAVCCVWENGFSFESRSEMPHELEELQDVPLLQN